MNVKCEQTRVEITEAEKKKMNPELNPEDPLLFDAVEGLSVLFRNERAFSVFFAGPNIRRRYEGSKAENEQKKGVCPEFLVCDRALKMQTKQR